MCIRDRTNTEPDFARLFLTYLHLHRYDRRLTSALVRADVDHAEEIKSQQSVASFGDLARRISIAGLIGQFTANDVGRHILDANHFGGTEGTRRSRLDAIVEKSLIAIQNDFRLALALDVGIT